MVFSLLVASRIGFDSTSPGDLLGWPGGLALGVIAALQLALLWRQPASWRALLVLVGITGTPELLLGSGWYLDFNHALPTNLLVGGMLVIGLFFNDRLAKRILRLGILGTAGLLVGALAVRQSLDLWVLTPYLLLLIGVPAVSYLLSWEPLYFRVLIFNGVLSTMHLGETTHRLARTNEHFQGLVPVFWGGVCLLLGVAISLDKGGSREGWPRPWGRLLERLRGSAAPDPPPRSLCPGTVDPGALSLGSAEDPPA